MREQQFASVWPYMAINTSWGPKDFKLSVSNNGIGPAKVSYIKYTYKDSTYYFTDELLREISKRDSFDLGNLEYGNITGHVIRPNMTVKLWHIQDSISSKKLLEKTKDIGLEICFCSVFDKCWIKTWNEYQPCESCED